MSDTGSTETAPRRRSGRELVLVVLVSMVVLIPGIGGYSLVDPWETHYGEVARNMLADGDLVHTRWPGTNPQGAHDEGFRSKPVLSFWMMAASMRAFGVADDGGYSGELTASSTVMVAIRLPFVLAAIAGLTLMWWMLARLVHRRLAWLALLVVGSTPVFCLIARQAIPDMPMVACVIGAISLFLLAVEDGDRPVTRAGRFDARHLVLGLACGFVLLQAIYYAALFARFPRPHVGLTPAIWLPASMVVMLGAMSRDGWLIVRLPFVAVGGVIVAVTGEPVPETMGAGRSRWRRGLDVLQVWDRHALDRYVVRALAFPFARVAGRGAWERTRRLAGRLFALSRITTMRQVYLLGSYFLLGLCLLAKGPPGFALVGLVGLFYVACFHRWRALLDGGFELKRGLVLVIVVAIPWHVGMWLVEGRAFIDEYWYQHILNRAADGSVDKSYGTFEYYTSQIGHGMWLWAALLPAALGATFARADRVTRAGRVRFVIALWAILGMALFCLIQTKFHHYIVPAIPPLALLVAFFLDDILAGRERLHPIYAALAAGIVLLVCRDLTSEPERWIEMFVYRYDRPWPSAEPYRVDPSSGFLGLGIVAVVAITVTSTRFRKIGIALLGTAGLAIALWALHVYMPIAGRHWGMREAARSYYELRTIYGEKVVYFGDAQLADDWKQADDTRTIETVVPDNVQLGQPMTVTVQLNQADNEQVTEREIVLAGAATAIGDHSVEVTLARGERAKLDPLVARGARSGKRGRPPVHSVDADRLIAWQLYWRGEQFWSAGEIWGWLPEMQTTFPSTVNNAPFLHYLDDRSRAPLGRRYFVITEAGRVNSLRSVLPTQRAKDSLEVVDATSNKFWLAAFYL